MSTGLAILTAVHVLISLIGIGAGLIVVYGLIGGRWLKGWNTWFLWTTILTSATGYLFPFHKLLPSHILGAMSLAVLAVSCVALYSKHLAGGWWKTYVITATIALYFNVFVLVAQLFGKVPALKALAPTQTETPFKVAQLVVLVAFVAVGYLATSRSKSLAVARTA